MTRKELKTLHGWVKAHRMPKGLEIKDCVCDLVKPCNHHAYRQRIYASQIPPQTMARLLDEIERLRDHNKVVVKELRLLRALEM